MPYQERSSENLKNFYISLAKCLQQYAKCPQNLVDDTERVSEVKAVKISLSKIEDSHIVKIEKNRDISIMMQKSSGHSPHTVVLTVLQG